MKYKEFKIGSAFFTGSGKWMCVDKGRRTVIAFKVTLESKSNKDWDQQDNLIFYHYDFGGCALRNCFGSKKNN